METFSFFLLVAAMLCFILKLIEDPFDGRGTYSLTSLIICLTLSVIILERF